jgi:hypothetical protein
MSQTTTPTRQLVIIDSRVNNYQSLVSDVGSDSAVLILNSSSDGLTQISDYLTTLPSKAFQSIHIISHGGVGSLLLGSSSVTGSNLDSYSKQLATMGNALTDTGDILLYGCNVAAGDIGQRFIEDLAGFTGADVAASDDLTGAAGLGGDWVLEVATGGIESSLALGAATLDSYAGILANPAVNVSAGVTPVEDGTVGTFTISLDSAAPAGGLTVNFSLAGTATLKTDYTVAAGTNITALTDGSFTVAEGQSSATLTVNALGDGVVDGGETVELNLITGSGYQLANWTGVTFAPKQILVLDMLHIKSSVRTSTPMVNWI